MDAEQMKSINQNRLGDNPIIVVLGLVSALIAIFVFLTGYESLPALLRTLTSPIATPTLLTISGSYNNLSLPTTTQIVPTKTQPIATYSTSVLPTSTKSATPCPQDFSDQVSITFPTKELVVSSEMLTVRWIGPQLKPGYRYIIAVTEKPDGWDAPRDGQFQTNEVRSNCFSTTFYFSKFTKRAPGTYDIRIWLMPPNQGAAAQFVKVNFIWQPSGR